jgi:hypothetical protein
MESSKILQITSCMSLLQQDVESGSGTLFFMVKTSLVSEEGVTYSQVSLVLFWGFLHIVLVLFCLIINL